MDDDRAQLMLVGAITIAVIFLGLVAVLNTGLYTSNVAPRAGLSATADAETFVDGVEHDMSILLGAAAEERVEGEVYAFDSTVTDETERYESYVLRSVGSERAATVNISLSNTIRGGGWLVVDDDVRGEFGPANDPDSPDWTLAEDVSNTSGTITLHRFPVHNDSENATFALEADGGSSEWRLETYWENESGGQVYIGVPSENEYCTFGQEQPNNASGVTIDLSEGSVQEVGCSFTAIDNSSELNDGGQYDLWIRRSGSDNAARARGTYTIAVDSTTYGDLHDGDVLEGKPNETNVPYSVPQLTAAEIGLHYTAPSLRYETDIRVEPTAVDLPPPPLTGRGLVFVNDSVPGNLSLLRGHNGPVTPYSVTDAQVIGPAEIDFDADNQIEVPYVDSAGALWLADGADPPRRLTADSEARASKSRLAVGRWNGSPVSVFYAGADAERIYRITPGGEPVEVVDASNTDGTNAAVGPADIDDDGEREFVYVGASQTIHYFDVESGINVLGSGQLSSNHGGAVGQPHDFSGDGRASIPFVDGSNNLNLINATNNAESLGPSADPAPLAVRDVNDDEETEIVYLDNEEAWFLTVIGPTTTRDPRELYRVGGSGNETINASSDQGVA